MMTLATTPGLEIMDRCGALTSVTWAPARWAMKSCSAGVTMWSFMPTMSHDGIVAQAGVPDRSVNALVARGRWVAARTAASLAGSQLAKQPGNTLCFLASERSGHSFTLPPRRRTPTVPSATISPPADTDVFRTA
jgi:hypothetical protein